MKKKIWWLTLAIIVSGALYWTVNQLKAEPVLDYALVSPTVKIESFRLARNGDIFQANSATATIISENGLLLTNSHVVLGNQDKPYDVFGVCLSFNDLDDPVCEYAAFLKAYDQDLDLALLQLSPLDNRGGQLGQLPYLTYDYSGNIISGDSLDIYGYPDVGGKTLTKTRGQISGFEAKSSAQYFKTDADISSGNSGGTALDGAGNFVGVPTYILSSYDNIGYVLDIKEATSFINGHLADEPKIEESSYELLKAKMNLFNNAKDNGYWSRRRWMQCRKQNVPGRHPRCGFSGGCWPPTHTFFPWGVGC